MSKTDREATQEHAVLNCLVNHTGKFLSGDLVEQIWRELVLEMRQGSCSWAFDCEPIVMGMDVPEGVTVPEMIEEKLVPTIRPRYTDIGGDK